jgi:hypothetical protein
LECVKLLFCIILKNKKEVEEELKLKKEGEISDYEALL